MIPVGYKRAVERKEQGGRVKDLVVGTLHS